MAQRFGRYWLQEKIGHGGMAEVFRATVGKDPDVYSFDFALKRLHVELLEDQRQRDMFSAETYLTKLMVHPNVIRHYESGEIDGRPYIAMEYVAGVQLAGLNEALIAKCSCVAPDLAVHIALQVLRALDYLHRSQAPGGKPMEIVHRDITPSNIYISRSGEVKIGDFGVARVKLLEPREDRDLLKGKVRYLAPEALIHGTVTQLNDIWSLGVCLYEMLAGRRLYTGLTERRILEEADRFKPPGPGDYGTAAVDRNLQEIVTRMLHPNPLKRFDSAARSYKALNTYSREAGFAVESGTLGRFVLGAIGRVAELSTEPIASERDRLTGIHSYQRMLELTQIEIDRSKRHGRVFSVLFLDLDDFHSVNERFGPELGDDIIRHIAQKVLPEDAGLRSSDFFGRRGEDRFLVGLPETPAEGGRVTAERIRSTLGAASWKALDDRLTVSPTVSIGVASYPSHGVTVGALMEASEVACFQAKREGKNRVLVASTEFGALKVRVSDGTATPVETARWDILTRLYREARQPVMPEQRRFARTELRVAVVVRDANIDAALYSKDFGMGGLRLQLPFEVRVGDELALQMVLPQEKAPVPAHVRVAWRRKDGVAGLEFIELPAYARELISTLINDTEPT